MATQVERATLRAVVVDDEPLARDELMFLLESCERVEVVGTAASTAEALELCRAQQPDLVFCDLRMPGPDGLALAEAARIGLPRVRVVMVSAHDSSAVPAFDVGVTDYLTKPVRLERLRSAVERVRELVGTAESARTKTPMRRFAVRKRGSYVVLEVKDVVCFEVEHEIVWARTAADRFALDLRLSAVAAMLPADEFFRCHRTTLVRLDRIAGLVPAGTGCYEIVLDIPSKHRVPLARERVRSLREKIVFSG